MTQNSIKTPSRLDIALDCLDRLGIAVRTEEGWVVVKIGGHIERMYLKPAEAIALALKLIAAAMTIENCAGGQ